MYPLYRDLRTRLGTPLWIDKHGVPRYDEFTPKEAAEIYDDCVLVMDVKCQSCGRIYTCVNSIAWYMTCLTGDILERTPENVLDKLFGWGDAPWHTQHGDQDQFDGQCAGTTMTTDYVAKELWIKEHKTGWVKAEIPEKYTQWEYE